MEYRYFRHPYNYKLFVVRSQGRIQGYAVCRFIYGEELSVMCVADYLFRPGSENLFQSLLVHIADLALRAGVTKVSAWCPIDNPHFRVFKRFGFFTKGVPVIAFQNDLARGLGMRALRWHFTLSDSDNI